MNIIIVGAGEIGTHIALSLAAESHVIVVIEADDDVADALDSRIDARVIAADGTSIAALVDAGVGDCDLFLTLTSDNNSNLVSASIAKRLGAKKTICRVHPGLQRETLFLDYGEHFGIDYLFSSERLAAVELGKYVRNPTSDMVEEIARGFVEIQQFTLPAGSPLCGRPLTEIQFPPRVRVGVINRGSEMIVPRADDHLLAGDLLTLFGEPTRLHDFLPRFRQHSEKEDELNIVIFGGGEYGFSLAQSLKSVDCRVRIFEEDENRCEALSDLLTNVTIIHADATSLAEMKEEQIGMADFFIATTQVDEDNVMSCLQAHSLGTKYCLPLIHRADYADAMTSYGEKMGILAAVSPREATRKDLARFITSDRFHLLRRLEGVELLETAVNEDSAIIGKKVRDIPWPKDCVLVALLGSSRGQVPAADDVIGLEDTLYALVKPGAKRDFLKLVAP
ncbi:MAG: Trk system potassium transporter TrkA [Verrucomicrobiaceae bacterium]|nr:Trk system potassium transporter TrkA [Verrucomicrobiaceae bacterium]